LSFEPVLPFVLINVATTADGKLAPANRHFVPFSARRDRELLLELRTTVDAVMSGARTVDLNPVNLGPGGAKYRELRRKRGLPEYNLRVVVSGSATLNPRAEIFRHRFSPIIILCCGRAPKRRLRALRAVANEVRVFGDEEVDFRAAFRWLRKKWKVKRLLCEGGGEVNEALFRYGLADEIYLTLCPLVFGGRDAPTMADGLGVSDLKHATRLKLKSLKRVGQEVYLVYRASKGRG
jgi:riboflavin-specific deaminase-like protein